MKPTLLIGAPGTGKTYQLIQEIQQRKPERFALVSFTKRAANEAKQRLSSIYPANQLKYVRTIHSLCFELLGLRTSQVVQWNHIRQFGNEYGYEFTGRITSMEDATNWNLTEDDIEFRQMNIDIAKGKGPSIHEIDIVMRWKKFKDDNNLNDYNDMIVGCLNDVNIPKFDLLCIDEFQDLSPLQLAFIDKLATYCKEIIYAGDDNQMIFEWAGVDRQRFMEISRESEIKILKENYRISGLIQNLSHEIVHRQKENVINHPSISVNENLNNIEYISSQDDPLAEGSYLILARNGYFLREVINELEDSGTAWSWLRDEYGNTKVKLGTIHSSKGSEADNVVLLTDVSPATYEHIDEDSEHRVWYVGVTRAKKKLYIVQPNTDYFYDLS